MAGMVQGLALCGKFVWDAARLAIVPPRAILTTAAAVGSIHLGEKVLSVSKEALVDHSREALIGLGGLTLASTGWWLARNYTKLDRRTVLPIVGLGAGIGAMATSHLESLSQMATFLVPSATRIAVLLAVSTAIAWPTYKSAKMENPNRQHLLNILPWLLSPGGCNRLISNVYIYRYKVVEYLLSQKPKISLIFYRDLVLLSLVRYKVDTYFSQEIRVVAATSALVFHWLRSKDRIQQLTLRINGGEQDIQVIKEISEEQSKVQIYLVMSLLTFALSELGIGPARNPIWWSLIWWNFRAVGCEVGVGLAAVAFTITLGNLWNDMRTRTFLEKSKRLHEEALFGAQNVIEGRLHSPEQHKVAEFWSTLQILTGNQPITLPRSVS